MKPWSLRRLIAVCFASLMVWAGVSLACVFVGHHGWGWPAESFIRGERLTTIAVASLVGGSLAAAGVTYQAVLRNPLAEPYLLGVSGGASLMAYLAAMSTVGAGAGAAAWLAPLGQQSASFIGAIAALVVVMLLSNRRGRLEPVTLLLVGVIISATCGAVYLLVYHLNLRREVTFGTGGPFRFLVGGINTNLTEQQIAVTAVIVAAGWGALMFYAGELNVASLSEAEARSLGVRIHRLRWIALIVASLMAAAAVSISGPIGFVGLICPHVARVIVGGDTRRLLPVATAFGASLLAAADAVSRAASTITYGPLPVGVLTGLLGGPFFLLLLWRQNMAHRAGRN